MVANIFNLGSPTPILTITPLGSPTSSGVEPSGTPEVLPRLSIHSNPFNPSTTISVELAHGEAVAVRIYDAQGRVVRTLENRVLGAGRHEVPWDGRNSRGQNVASGVYFVRVESATFRMTGKALLMK